MYLHFRHPQAVEIAVGVNSNSLVITETEGNVGRIAGLQGLALTAIFGLNVDPLDVVFGDHGMIHAAHVDMDGTVFNSDNRQMLLAAGLRRVGDQGIHLLTTSDDGNTGIIDHADQVAAVAANIEFFLHDRNPPTIYLHFNCTLSEHICQCVG